MNKETVMELQKTLKPVIDKLGQGGHFIYSAYYKQQIIEAISNLVWVIFFSVISYLGLKMWHKADKISKNDHYSESPIFLKIICIIIWVFSLIIIPMCINEAIGKFINPEYYIIQDLLSIVKKP